MSSHHQLALFTPPPGHVQPLLRKRSGVGVPRRPRERDSLRLCVLGSGSGGNASVVRLGKRAMLIDAGLGPRTIARRLGQAGLTHDHLAAVCVTHFDRDHFRPTWLPLLLAHRIRLCLHRWHLPDFARLPDSGRLRDAGLVHVFDDEAFDPAPDLPITAAPIRLQHDRQGTIGYRIESIAPGGGAIGYATDLGHAPSRLIDHFAGVDLLCIESNYDHHMTIHSSRPSFVNRRNLSDSGHLSNDQAFEAARRITDAGFPHGPRHIVLLHRSSQCNHPMKVRRTFEADSRFVGHLVLTEQRRRTRWLTVAPRRAVARAQMPLAIGMWPKPRLAAGV